MYRWDAIRKHQDEMCSLVNLRGREREAGLETVGGETLKQS